MELELLQWADGTVRLSYEDRIHGNDVHFVLGEDGRAFLAKVQPDETETLEPVDLVLELRKMAQQ